MRAAVVHAFGRPPVYEDFPPPTAADGQTLVTVRAAALSQLVKARAAGKHYSGVAKLPFLPGVDGVGRTQAGQRVYFAFPVGIYGSMAEITVVPTALCVPLPDAVDDVTAAGIANPGMSSWAALVERACLQPGETVLINGATGTSGRLAVQIAKHLGAGRVIATGRNAAVLEQLKQTGADATISLTQSPEQLTAAFREQFAAGVNVVLDYLWGEPAERLLAAAPGQVGRGLDDVAPRIRFVQIGSMAGPTVSLPAMALRSSRLELMGSGIGSVSTAHLIDCVAGVLQAAAAGKLSIDVQAVPLSQVESAWDGQTADRVVFTM